MSNRKPLPATIRKIVYESITDIVRTAAKQLSIRICR